MQPGPDYIIHCPHCEAPMIKHSIISGNTFGAKSYSDGKRDAPMMPSYPDITICWKCEEIFWVKDAVNATELPQFYTDSKMNEIRFLNLDEIAKAIENGLSRNKKEEIELRIEMWWFFNDRVRDDEPLFIEDWDEVLYTTNAKRLIELFQSDLDNMDRQIMTAELQRNLGNFGLCMDMLNKIKDPNCNWIKNKFKEQCDAKNSLVFEF